MITIKKLIDLIQEQYPLYRVQYNTDRNIYKQYRKDMFIFWHTIRTTTTYNETRTIEYFNFYILNK
jgi:hypothetical protein